MQGLEATHARNVEPCVILKHQLLHLPGGVLVDVLNKFTQCTVHHAGQFLHRFVLPFEQVKMAFK